MKENQIINVWSTNRVIEPHQLRRYPLTFAIQFAVVGGIVSIVAFTMLATLPPSASAAGFGEIAKASLKVIAHKASGGFLWKIQGPAILAAIADSGAASWIIAKAVIAGAIGAAAAWTLSKGRLEARTGYKHVRGSQLHSGAAAKQKINDKLTAGDVAYIHPDYKVAQSEWGTGAVIVGSAGSGKTSILMPFIKRLLNEDEKFMTLDCKFEQVEKLGPKVAYFAPWLKGSLVPDVGRDISGDAEAQAFANSLIKIESGAGKIWSSAANAVLAALVSHLVQTKPLSWGWADLSKLLAGEVAEWIEILKSVNPSIVKVLDTADATQAGVVFNIATSLRNLANVSKLFEEGLRHGSKLFSVRRWLTEKDYQIRQIVLVQDKAHEGEVGFLIPWILDNIGMAITGLENGTRDKKFFVLDEFAQLPKIEMLPPYFEMGRSKGLQTIIATQDWSQVERTYSRETATTIFNNASVKVICMTTTGTTQKQLSDWIGTREVSHDAISLSSSGGGSAALNSSRSSQEKVSQIILPSQLGEDLGPRGKVIGENGKQQPKTIRALLVPMRGGAFVLDWPFTLANDMRQTPRALPSQHRGTALVRQFTNNQGQPLADNIKAAMARLKAVSMPMSYHDLAGLLFTDGQITKQQWDGCQAKGAAKALIDELTGKPAARDPGTKTDIQAIAGYPTEGRDAATAKSEDKTITPQGAKNMEQAREREAEKARFAEERANAEAIYFAATYERDKQELSARLANDGAWPEIPDQFTEEEEEKMAAAAAALKATEGPALSDAQRKAVFEKIKAEAATKAIFEEIQAEIAAEEAEKADAAEQDRAHVAMAALHKLEAGQAEARNAAAKGEVKTEALAEATPSKKMSIKEIVAMKKKIAAAAEKAGNEGEE